MGKMAEILLQRRDIQQRFETRNSRTDGRCAVAVLNTYVNSQDCKHVAWHLLEDNKLFEDSSFWDVDTAF